MKPAREFNENALPPMLSVDRHIVPLLDGVLSRATIYNKLIKMPGFPLIKCGSRYIVPRDRFFQFMDEQAMQQNNDSALRK